MYTINHFLLDSRQTATADTIYIISVHIFFAKLLAETVCHVHDATYQQTRAKI